MLLYIIFQDCSLRRTYCKYFWGVADCTHHGSHFIQLWCTYARTLLKHGQIVTPGAFYARAWVYFMTTLLCRDLFSLNMFGLLYTPGELYASMHVRSCDLRGGGGDREVWLSSYFYADIAASYVPVYANQTWAFITWFLSTGPQSLVNLRTSNIYCVLSLLCILIFTCFIWNIEHLCAMQKA